MKRILIPIIGLFLISCSASSSSVYSASDEINHNSTSSFFDSPEEVDVNIVYKYENGEIIETINETKVVGEEFYYISPSIDFMVPSEKIFDGIVSNDGINKEIIYSYSPYGNVDLGINNEFTNFMVDEEKGLSFTYIDTNLDSKWTELIKGSNYSIHNGRFKLFDENQNEFISEFKEYTGLITKGYTNNELLVNSNEEMLITFSINPNGSVKLYKNGELLYYWAARVYNSVLNNINGNAKNKCVDDFAFAALKDLKENGFTLLKQVNELKLDYAVNDEKAKQIASSYAITKIRYIDSNNHDISESVTLVDRGNEEYNISSPTIDLLVCDKEIVNGVSTKGYSEVLVNYTFDGSEQITSEIIKDNTNIFGWGNKENMIEIANELVGDFIVSVKHRNEGIRSRNEFASTSDVCWRTSLNYIYDSITNDCWTSRHDWLGWLTDRNSDNINLGNNETYSSNYFDNYNDDIYKVYKDCMIYTTYKRVGSTISITSFIEPNDEEYKNKVYKYHYSISNVNCEKISIALSSEDAKVTLLSVVY